MSHRQTSIRISSHSRAQQDTHESSGASSEYEHQSDTPEEGWEDEEEDDEDDLADSTEGPEDPYHHSRSAAKQATRQHHLTPTRGQPPPSGYGYRPAPGPVQHAPASLDPSEEYSYGYGQYPPMEGHYGGPRDLRNRGYGHHGGGYAQSHAGGYGPYGSQQVVHGSYGNPFAPSAGGRPAHNYLEYGGWGGNEMNQMMGPYGGGAGFFSGGHYPVPPIPMAMQQYAAWPTPPPPQAERQKTPVKTPPASEPPKEDPEKIAMMKKLAEIEAEQKKVKEEADRKAAEAKIRAEAEAEFKRKMEEREREDRARAEERAKAEKQQAEDRAAALAKAKEEIEAARKAAEQATREAVAAEKKAAEERAKAEADVIARAERAALEKIEAAKKAEEERAKKEAEMAAAAELAARLKLEAAQKLKDEAEAAAAKKAKEEEEWRKTLQEEAKLKAELEARAKIEAERKAAEDAAAADKAKKEEEEAFKKRALEEAKVKAEEANKKAMGKDKAPIKFKDAVGRKFSFPFHLCQTWNGMEELIKQAFLHVDVIGPHVQAGHYDLLGPDGEIILPQIWDRVIEPDQAITMVMWPMDRMDRPPLGMPRAGGPPGVGQRGQAGPPPGMAGSRYAPMDPRAGGRGGAIPVPPHPNVRPPHMHPANARVPQVIPVMKQEKKKGSKSSGQTLAAAFFGVKPSKKKSSSKHRT